MGIRNKNEPVEPPIPDSWNGPWGEISTSELNCLQLTRLQDGIEECWSYPYPTLLRWVHRKTDPETIEILAGGDTVTLYGFELEPLFEALGAKSLKQVRVQSVRFTGKIPGERVITQIEIEISD